MPTAAPSIVRSEPEQRVYRSYRSSRNLTGCRADAAGLRETFRIFDARYAKHLPRAGDARILEIGCGDGTFLSYLLSRGFHRVEGVDSSVEQVRAAWTAGSERVTLGDNLERLKRFDGELDLVVALDVLEHYPKPELLSLLDAIHDALKQTGRLLVQTTNADGPFGSRHRYLDFTHETSFTPSSLGQALRLAGFTRVDFEPVQPVVHGFPSLLRWCAWKAIRLAMVCYLAVETGCVGEHVLTQNMIAVARK